jgi:hypothetical protein
VATTTSTAFSSFFSSIATNCHRQCYKQQANVKESKVSGSKIRELINNVDAVSIILYISTSKIEDLLVSVYFLYLIKSRVESKYILDIDLIVSQ